MERYTEKTPSGEVRFKENVTSLTTGMWDVCKRLAHYEEAECDGRMLILPVPEGAEVWEVKKTIVGKKTVRDGCDHMGPLFHEEYIYGYVANLKRFELNDIKEFGKTVFATEAEANKILIEKKGK